MVGDPEQARHPLKRLLERDQKRFALRRPPFPLGTHDLAHRVVARRGKAHFPGTSRDRTPELRDRDAAVVDVPELVDENRVQVRREAHGSSVADHQ
jgi:hypothetical protein